MSHRKFYLISKPKVRRIKRMAPKFQSRRIDERKIYRKFMSDWPCDPNIWPFLSLRTELNTLSKVKLKIAAFI